MLSKQSVMSVALIAMSATAGLPALQAAPLLGGSKLQFEFGGSPASGGMCTVGSCFGMEVQPDFWIWTMVGPGNDGGFVVGKNQLSGGQETTGVCDTTPGDISAAWFFFGCYGTFFADNAQNLFSDVSNDGGTALNDFNVAWNGSVIPMGGGSVDDYVITLDGAGGGSWSLDYSQVVPEGPFIGVPFRMIARGNVIDNSIITDCFVVVTNDISLLAESDATIPWVPDYYECPDISYNCAITSNASNGNATVNSDCSGGTYTSGAGFEGIDTFQYTVTDQRGLSGTATVNVLVELPQVFPGVCLASYPLKSVTTIGGGQSPTVNASLQTTFTGQITTEAGLTTGGKNSVKICPGTTVDFTVTSTVGEPACIINSAATASTGTLAIGDKLICTNKPDGSDTDRFTIKSGQ